MVYSKKRKNTKRKNEYQIRSKSKAQSETWFYIQRFFKQIDFWNINNLINTLSFLTAVIFVILVFQKFLENNQNQSNIAQSNIRPFTNLYQENNKNTQKGDIREINAQDINQELASSETIPPERIEKTGINQEQHKGTEEAPLTEGQNINNSPKTINYNIKSGDTLSKISSDKNISLVDILNLNPDLQPPYSLQVGQEIILPKN